MGRASKEPAWTACRRHRWRRRQPIHRQTRHRSIHRQPIRRRTCRRQIGHRRLRHHRRKMIRHRPPNWFPANRRLPCFHRRRGRRTSHHHLRRKTIRRRRNCLRQTNRLPCLLRSRPHHRLRKSRHRMRHHRPRRATIRHRRRNCLRQMIRLPCRLTNRPPLTTSRHQTRLLRHCPSRLAIRFHRQIPSRHRRSLRRQHWSRRFPCPNRLHRNRHLIRQFRHRLSHLWRFRRNRQRPSRHHHYLGDRPCQNLPHRCRFHFRRRLRRLTQPCHCQRRRNPGLQNHCPGPFRHCWNPGLQHRFDRCRFQSRPDRHRTRPRPRFRQRPSRFHRNPGFPNHCLGRCRCRLRRNLGLLRRRLDSCPFRSLLGRHLTRQRPRFHWSRQRRCRLRQPCHCRHLNPGRCLPNLGLPNHCPGRRHFQSRCPRRLGLHPICRRRCRFRLSRRSPDRFRLNCRRRNPALRSRCPDRSRRRNRFHPNHRRRDLCHSLDCWRPEDPSRHLDRPGHPEMLRCRRPARSGHAQSRLQMRHSRWRAHCPTAAFPPFRIDASHSRHCPSRRRARPDLPDRRRSPR